ncbi:unnamed protein product, partial [Ectocarpus sp. 13 AM-2016]
QGKHEKAKPLLERSVAINEATFGLEHPHVVASLNDLAAILEKQGKYAEAQPLYERSLAINEKTHGPDHQDVATSLNNLAVLVCEQGNYVEARRHLERALQIRTSVLGGMDPDTIEIRDTLEFVRDQVGENRADTA